MLKTHHIMTSALATLAITACGGGNRATTDTAPAPGGTEGYAVVRVENQNIRDMRIYVRPGAGGSRFRLGTANGLETTLLKIPRTMVTGVTDLTFEITPLGGGGSQFSEKITANPGEEIVLRIGP
jgi:hypothetical protein